MKRLFLLMIIGGSIHSVDALGGFFAKYWKRLTIGLFATPVVHYCAVRNYKDYDSYYAILTHKYDTENCKYSKKFYYHYCAYPETRYKDCPKNSCANRKKLIKNDFNNLWINFKNTF